jgi:4,5-dihydroxyphthalate decarboxylase
MARLGLSVAVRDYDRTRPLTDGSVPIDGVDPVFMTLSPEEIFFRAFRHAEFDICELSLSSFVVKTAQGSNPYVGVPAFVSRAFRHTSIYVRTDRIKKPADLKGRKVGTPEYQLTACVWARALLEDDFGVTPSDLHWIRGGLEEPGRPEKIALQLPSNVQLDEAPPGTTLSGLLEAGEIDAFIGPRVPSCFEQGRPHIGWLFSDPTRVAAEYFRRTGIFPIMHLVGVRRQIVEQHPWLPVAVLKAFDKAKAIAVERLADTSSTKVTLPFVEEQLKAARELMGRDFWSYGVNATNRKVLETFLKHHHAQGLSPRLVKVEELFHPATLETFKI